MSRVIVTYNAPSREYIGYVEGEGFRPVTVTDAEVDATAADQQRQAYEVDEETRRSHAKNVGGHFEARTFAPVAPSHQQVRERIALELATDRLRALGADVGDSAPVDEEPSSGDQVAPPPADGPGISPPPAP